MSPSQFDSEIAAPALKIKDPNWHRSHELHQECEWKQGDGGCEQKREGRKFRRLPLVGGHPCGWHDQKTKPFPPREKFGWEYASRWSEVAIVGDTTKNKTFPPREKFGRSAPPVGRGSPLWVTRPKTKPFPRRETFGREYASRWSGMTTVGGTTKFVLDTGGLLMEAATARKRYPSNLFVASSKQNLSAVTMQICDSFYPQRSALRSHS